MNDSDFLEKMVEQVMQTSPSTFSGVPRHHDIFHLLARRRRRKWYCTHKLTHILEEGGREVVEKLAAELCRK